MNYTMTEFTYPYVSYKITNLDQDSVYDNKQLDALNIVVNPQKMVDLFGVKPGTIVKNGLQGSGIVLGLKILHHDQYTLIFQFESERKITYWSDVKTWQDCVNKGVTLMEEQIHVARYAKYMNNQKYSDIKFLVGQEKKEYFGHRMVICEIEYFDKLLSSGMSEALKGVIELPDMEALYFEIILEYIYTGNVILNKDSEIDILKLHALAGRLMMTNLQVYCSMIMKELLDFENCVSLLNFAVTYIDQDLEAYIMRFILCNYSKLVEHDNVIKELHELGLLPIVMAQLAPKH